MLTALDGIGLLTQQAEQTGGGRGNALAQQFRIVDDGLRGRCKRFEYGNGYTGGAAGRINDEVGGLLQPPDSLAAFVPRCKAVLPGISLFGGRGTMIGVVLGVMIVGLINNGLNVSGLPTPVQDVVRGSIIILAVAIDNWRRRSA